MWLDLGEYRGPSHFHAFVGFCIGRTRQRQTIAAYRTYVTESLRLSPQGKYLSRTFEAMTRPHEDIDVNATIEHVIRGLELEVTDEPA